MLTTSGDRVALFITPMKIWAQPIQYWQHYVRPHSDTHSYGLIVDGVIIIFLAANHNSQSCVCMVLCQLLLLINDAAFHRARQTAFYNLLQIIIYQQKLTMATITTIRLK